MNIISSTSRIPIQWSIDDQVVIRFATIPQKPAIPPYDASQDSPNSFQYKIIPIQPSIYSTHSSGLWCHSYTVAKPCRSPAIGRLATQARENTSSWARHSPKLSPAGPCVYRNFVPHPPPPSICLCQCIVWDPLASRKLMLTLEIWKTIAPFDFIYRRTCLLPLEENGKCATVFCSNTLAMRIYIINFGLETSNYYLFTKQIINTYIVSIHIWVTYYIYILYTQFISCIMKQNCSKLEKIFSHPCFFSNMKSNFSGYRVIYQPFYIERNKYHTTFNN